MIREDVDMIVERLAQFVPSEDMNPEEKESSLVKSKKLFKLLKRKKIALKACEKFLVFQKGKTTNHREIPSQIIDKLNLKKVTELNHIFLMADEKKMGFVTIQKISSSYKKNFLGFIWHKILIVLKKTKNEWNINEFEALKIFESLVDGNKKLVYYENFSKLIALFEKVKFLLICW